MASMRRSDRAEKRFRRRSLWYKDAVIYELHVRAFCDGNQDGIGDFQGLISKLDYLADLGVDAIWLLPFYPSPLKDDGYDIADYTDVHPDYGTLQDFKNLLREAHRRGIYVITELVLNHTSDQHAWFQRARRAKPGSRARDFYVWSDTAERYAGTRIIFQDFEPSNWSWDSEAGAYFWHRFYSHQPDLNFDNPAVRRALLQVVDFWFQMGVDGMRLDAVPYLYEREGTSCENLPETHAFLKQLRSHVDAKFDNRMLLAEANQWPEDAVAYFGDGDECHMNFHFPLMPRLFMAQRMADRYPIIDILQQTPPIPEGCQWCVFLRNHDELTLEMVTDEDRDYMYQVYARDPQMRINLGIRRRLSPLLDGDRRKIELMYALLFSLPGTPVIYYGDEIGMGDNFYLGDRNGVRTPMQWTPDRNAGFSRVIPHQLYLPVILDPAYHFEAVNVEAQQSNSTSLLWWLKRMIGRRRRYSALARGSIEFLHPENRRVLAFIREHGEERILVLANLSGFAQYVELDLEEFQGAAVQELFGGARFPDVSDDPYPFTLGPNEFMWLSLEAAEVRVAGEAGAKGAEPPRFEVAERWTRMLEGARREELEAVLREYVPAQRWFASKARSIDTVHIADVLRVERDPLAPRLLLLDVTYETGDPERYVVPVGFVSGPLRDEVAREWPDAVMAHLLVTGTGDEPALEGVLFDPLVEPTFGRALLDMIDRRRSLKGETGKLAGTVSRVLRKLWPKGEPVPEPSPMGLEQSNTSVRFGDQLVLKVLRKVVTGPHPEVEVGRFLTEVAGYDNAPPLGGTLEYQPNERGDSQTVAVLQGFVPNEGDAWVVVRDAVRDGVQRVLAEGGLPEEEPSLAVEEIWEVSAQESEEQAWNLVGPILGSIELMGQRTGELHAALARSTGDASFDPESFPPHYHRSLYQSVHDRLGEAFDLLKRKHRSIPASLREDVEALLGQAQTLDQRVRHRLPKTFKGKRTRVHGDLHLGQILYTGRDFVLIDFEGEPARSLSARRAKHSPLRDVAGMLRSLHYAALYDVATGELREEDVERIAPWLDAWVREAWIAFLRGYRVSGVFETKVLPAEGVEAAAVLEVMLIDKAAYEVSYELNNRPGWVGVPVGGLLRMLGA
jgi:maltose alpha-D-glucosyltransferase/alpha-amylase